MSIYLFTPAPVAPSGAKVKVFTDSGCTALATITSVEGLPIPGSVIPSDGQTGALPHFLGPQTSLWLKVQVTGGATVALTATDSGPAANPGGAYVPVTRQVAGHALSADVTLVKGDVGLGNVDNTADTAKPVSTAQQTVLDLKAQALVPTAVKTANYTAAAADFVPVDTTSGAVTVTLPTAPADKTLVGIKHVTQGGTNAVTVALGGSDVVNKTGGVTSFTMPLLAQAVILQYKASGAIWYVLDDDLPLSQLDARFQAAGLAALKANNLSDLASAATARTNIGLGNVDNTADTAKPVSTAQQTALNLKADLASPALTGSPTAPTQTAGDNSTKVSTTAYVDTAAVAANTQSGTTYTLVLGDQGKVVRATNASAVTVTVPPNSSVAFPVGAILSIYAAGAGGTTIAAGAGVTIRNNSTALVQYGECSLRKDATDEWVRLG